MSENSSLDSSLSRFQFSKKEQLLLLLCNYFQAIHVIGTLCLFLLPIPIVWRIWTAVATFYLLPPLLARLTLALFPIQGTSFAIPSQNYFTWWFLLNLQMVFCRFPCFEELLRVLPMVYSGWLRLWGARIGKHTYWAAGLRILDRSFLDIGHGVVFGAGVRLNPHVIAEDKEGVPRLLLAVIVIEDQAVIGGYSLLTTGNRICRGEATRAVLHSPPFSTWQGGKRVSKANREV